MKWRRKKSNNNNHSASSRFSLFSQVFPISWISKFKQMDIKSEPKHAKTKWKTKPMSPSLNSTPRPEVPGRRMSQRRSRALTEMDGDDDFWRLSFGGESSDGKKSRAPLRSVWYDSEDELEFPPRSSCRSCRSGATTTGTEEPQNFSNMVSDIRKNRGSPANVKSEDQEFETAPKKIPKDSKETSRKSRKSDARTAEKEQFLLHIDSVEENQQNQNCSSRQSLYVSSYARKSTTAVDSETTHQIGSDSEKNKAKDLKIEFLSRYEKQGKSAYDSGELQRRTKRSCKVRVCSPRTPSKSEVCKIKALEDMKKAKMKKMKMKERAAEETSTTTTIAAAGLKSFAVVKCSFDPENDFRESMVEMISENQIGRKEDFEELLACYLTLNSVEYHDLIIKVFKQVWFDLKGLSFCPDYQ